MAKRKSGVRTKAGKLKGPTTRAARSANDYGNDRVQALKRLFSTIAEGKALDEIHDGIGRLWALGYLDGHGIDPVALRDAGREWGKLWHQTYSATAPRVGTIERASRTSGGHDGATRDDRCFAWMDANLARGSFERAVLVDLILDPWWHDEVAIWVQALVTTKLRELKIIPPVAIFATAHDHDLLAAAVRGLCSLACGTIPKAQAA